MVGAPLGLLLSVVAIFVDQNKKPAIVGLTISLLLAGLFCFVALCR